MCPGTEPLKPVTVRVVTSTELGSSCGVHERLSHHQRDRGRRRADRRPGRAAGADGATRGTAVPGGGGAAGGGGGGGGGGCGWGARGPRGGPPAVNCWRRPGSAPMRLGSTSWR